MIWIEHLTRKRRRGRSCNLCISPFMPAALSEFGASRQTAFIEFDSHGPPSASHLSAPNGSVIAPRPVAVGALPSASSSV